MSIVKCERGDILIEEQGGNEPVWPIRGGLPRLSITGSGEPTSCALVATKQLLPNGPQRTPLQISRTELPVGMADILYFGCFLFFASGPSERETWNAPVYKLRLVGVICLHDCMEKLNVNL